MSRPETLEPEDLVRLAEKAGAPVLASTYNEPLITSEWAMAVFRAAREKGLLGAYISNGNGTPEVLEFIRPFVSLYKVDLKSMRDRNYRALGGRLQTVLDTITALPRMGFWVEIVTLIVPGFNDSEDELRDAARFLRGVSPDIPWHVTAFHKDYKMTDPDDTSAATLVRAAGIGLEEGLRFVYAGNLPGRVGDFEDTRCPGCAATLVKRSGYRILDYRITRGGACPGCDAPVPGVWHGGAVHLATGSGKPRAAPAPPAN